MTGITINPYFLVREAFQNPGEKDVLPDGFFVHTLQPEHAGLVSELNEWSTPEEVTRRLQNGHICVVLRNNEDVAGYTWADLAQVNDSACPYQLSQGEAYLYDAFVGEKYRGGGLASKMRTASYRKLFSLGITGFVSVSDYFNTGSIKFKSRLGAQPERLYLQIKLGSRELCNWLLKHYRDGSLRWR